MIIAEHSRLQVRLNLLGVQHDLLQPLIDASIIQAAYERAEAVDRKSPDTLARDLYAPMFFAEQWIYGLQALDRAVRAIGADPSFAAAAEVAMESYNGLFPGLSSKPILSFVSVGADGVIANGPEGWVQIPITREALATLHQLVCTLVDALGSEAPLLAAG